MIFSAGQRVTITLRDRAFRTVNAKACIRYAAIHGLMRRDILNSQPGGYAPLVAAAL